MIYDMFPGQIMNFNHAIKYDELVSTEFNLKNLIIGKNYEFRVSWPSTSPIKVYFKMGNSLSSSDEKIVFQSELEEEKLEICIKGIGISRFSKNYIYQVPINVSLEQQYFGITIHVWRLVTFLLPTLLCVFVITHFLGFI